MFFCGNATNVTLEEEYFDISENVNLFEEQEDSKKFDLNKTDTNCSVDTSICRDGYAPLETDFLDAAENGDLLTVQECINQKVNVNCKNSKDFTALHLASMNAHDDIVGFLLRIRDALPQRLCLDLYVDAKYIDDLPGCVCGEVKYTALHLAIKGCMDILQKRVKDKTEYKKYANIIIFLRGAGASLSMTVDDGTLLSGFIDTLLGIEI